MSRSVYHLFLPFLLSLGIVLLLTPWVRVLLMRLGLVDKPSSRRINKNPIPRGGGLGLFIGTMITGYLWHTVTGSISPWLTHGQYMMFVLASGILVFVGFIDDALDLKPVLKLLGQIIVATILYESGISLGDAIWINVPPLIDYAVTLAWYIIIINAFNLIDGMDGLASGLALIGSVGLTVCLISRGKNYDAVPLVILAGACLGFLRYNFNPASIFLGDCGSMFIGLVLATVPLITGGKSAFLASLGVPLLIMGVPLFDTVLAIWRRSMRAMIPDKSGKHEFGRIMKPDMEHLHHRFLSAGLTQRRAAWVLYVVSLVMVCVAVGVTLFSSRSTGIILIGTLIIIIIMVRHLSRVELWDTGQAFMSMSKTSRFVRYLIPIYVFGDILVLLLSWIFSFDVAFVYSPNMYLRSVFPIFIAATMLAMLVTGVYRRIWNLANARDFSILLISVFGGWCLGVAITIIMGLRYNGFNRQIFVYLLLSVLPIMMIRICRLLMSSVMSAAETMRLVNDAKSQRILVYGAGERYTMVDLALNGSLLGTRTGYPVAVIDDNPHLHGRLVRGQKIVGGIDDIDSVVKTYKPDVLLISAVLEPENRVKALAAVKKYDLLLMEWKCGMEMPLSNEQEKKEHKK